MIFGRILKDRLAKYYMFCLTVFCILLLFFIGAGLFYKAWPIIKEKNIWHLLTTSNWRPFKNEFGFLTFILSTCYITAIAIILALPFALLTSVYLSEYATKRMKQFFYPVVDLLSGIPPVIYGVWGSITIVPFISEKLAPHFVDFSTGYSVLAGGIVLAIMIIPLIISVVIEVLNSIPAEMREASYSVGATKNETIFRVLFRKAAPGIVAAIVLAVSRAFGETIAVLMICGNMTVMPHSIFDSCYPLPALIANNYGEMMSMPNYESALMFAALLLFVIIVLFNAISRIVLNHVEKRYQ